MYSVLTSCAVNKTVTWICAQTFYERFCIKFNPHLAVSYWMLFFLSIPQTVITAVDQRIPEKTGTGTVTINVNYDDFAPQFTVGTNNLLQAVINENMDIGLSVARVSARDEDIVQDNQVWFWNSHYKCFVNSKYWWFFSFFKHVILSLTCWNVREITSPSKSPGVTLMSR